MFEWLMRLIRKIFGKDEVVETPTTTVEAPSEVVAQKPMEREAESEPKTSTLSQPETLSTSELPQSVQAEVAFQQGLISTMKEVLASKEPPPPVPTPEVKTGNGEYIWLAQRPTEDGGINVALVPVEPKTKAPEIAPPKKKKEAPKKTKRVKATIKVDVPKDKKSKKAK